MFQHFRIAPFSPISLLFIFISTAPTFQCVIFPVIFLFVVVQASTCTERYLGEISVTDTLYSFDGSSLYTPRDES